MKKFNLTADIILNKKFKNELSGYSATEVDKYLDQIIDDYRQYEDREKANENILDEKQKLIMDREQTIEKLKLEINNLKSQIKSSEKYSTYELHQEIRRLREELNSGK